MLNKIQQQKIKERNKKIKYIHNIEGLTLREIGKIYSLSYERVRQILAKKEGVEK